MRVPLSINVFERGDAGIPSTTFIGDLRGRVNSYEHSIRSQFGYESMTVTLTVPLAEALDWLQDGLMRSVIVSGPGGRTVWEGYLQTVEAVFGQETRSLSIDGMANRIRVLYTGVLGQPGTTSSISGASSQGLYGIKDMVLSAADSDDGEATYYGTVELARRSNPRMQPITEVATGSLGDTRLTLSFVGWYEVLGWLVTSNSLTSKIATTTQIGTLLTSYTGVNNFLSTSTYNLVASGISVTQKIEANTTYREKIEDLLKRGNGTQPYAWGVYENRVFAAQPWAGATPEVVTYRRHLGGAQVYDAYGNAIAPWDVRPDAMYQVVELLDVGPVTTAQDAAARFYVARVVCTISDGKIGVSLEPEEPFDLAAILVRKY